MAEQISSASAASGNDSRLSTGIPALDERLGGGLLPGTLTVVIGASGIGKTQLGVQFANAGLQQEGRRGILFDMNARIDAQSHADYAQRMFGWQPAVFDPNKPIVHDRIFSPDGSLGEYLHVFDQSGRRVVQHQADFDTWHDWQAELGGKLSQTIAFFYQNFARGVRRAVIDGIEPVDKQGDSIQFELFEYVYHQILRKESEWVARDLFREHYLANAELVKQHAYDHRQIGCVMLYTSHETMLDGLIERPLQDGDLFAGANTLIYLGKIREGKRLQRAMYIAKHRGSACSDEIATYEINDAGLQLDE